MERASPGTQASPPSWANFHTVFTWEFFSPGRRTSSGYMAIFKMALNNMLFPIIAMITIQVGLVTETGPNNEVSSTTNWAGQSPSKFTFSYISWLLKLWRYVFKFSAISESQRNSFPSSFPRIFLAEVLTETVNSAILYQNVNTRITACAYRNFPARLAGQPGQLHFMGK